MLIAILVNEAWNDWQNEREIARFDAIGVTYRLIALSSNRLNTERLNRAGHANPHFTKS